MTFRRPVSPNERLYLACAPLFPPFCIQLLIEGSGHIDEDDLRRVLADDPNPGARLVLKGGEWIDGGRPPRVRRAIGDVAHEPLTDATCEIVLLAENGILFRAFHGVMDARGLLLWVEDVFKGLRGEPPIGANSTLTDKDAVQKHARPRRAMAARDSSLSEKPRAASWSHLHLDEAVPNLVSKIAAFVASRAGKPCRMMIPVDLRPHFPEVRTTGNFSNPLFVDVAPGDEPPRIQQQILRRLAAGEEFATSSSDRALLRVPLWMQRLAIRSAQSLMMKRNRFLISAVLSHLGRVSLASLSTESFAATSVRSLPLDTPFCPLTAVITEHERGTEISLSSNADTGEMAGALRSFLLNVKEGPSAPLDDSLLDLISRAPRDLVAISKGSTKVTYGELEAWSHRLASTLPSDALIGVMMDHSIELIVALVAVLKAGSAFVPLDPRLPRERVDFILSDAGVKKVLTGADLSSLAPTPFKPREGRLAYVIYTSGSTGRPKGVQISTRNFLNYLLWAKGFYLGEMTERVRSALVTSIGFDLTLTSIFLPLISEGEIRIYDGDPLIGLKNLVGENAVNFLKLTPSHLRMIPPMSRVKTLIVGGEQLPTELARKWTCEVYNEYGPTEATIGCLVHRFQRSQDRDVAVPIGRPIANTVAYLSNGELVIGGEGVANGYVGPSGPRFFESDGRRFYRTGDLVAENPNGDFVYAGRVDRQIKVNGNRIEPAEIESALLSCSGVATASVGVNSRLQLVGYFTAATDAATPPLEEAIRRELEGRLPKAMIPLFLKRVDALPQTDNGKIDFDCVFTEADPLFVAGDDREAGGDVDLDERALLIRSHAGRLLSLRPETIPVHVSMKELGLDSLGLVILLDSLSKEFYAADGESGLFDFAHEFVDHPSIERISSVIEKTAGRGNINRGT